MSLAIRGTFCYVRCGFFFHPRVISEHLEERSPTEAVASRQSLMWSRSEQSGPFELGIGHLLMYVHNVKMHLKIVLSGTRKT